jgi:hypothetical protein
VFVFQLRKAATESDDRQSRVESLSEGIEKGGGIALDN